MATDRKDDKFEYAISVVLAHEGGETVDHAGLTRFGISTSFLKSLGKDGDLNNDGVVDDKDTKLVTKSLAIQLYKTHFWDKFGYGQIQDKYIATKIFDMAVNMGAGQAHKIVQRALNWLGYPCAVDGILGSITRQLISKVDPKRLMLAICLFQERFYLDLVINRPEFIKFKNGWLNRARWSGQYKL